MAPRSQMVQPSKHQDTLFNLYSIPAYDSGAPELALGKDIGSAKQTVKSGDVLLSRIVPHIRRAWVVGDNDGRESIASNEWIVLRHPDVDATYLRHVLMGDWFHARFMNTVAGVGGSLLRAKSPLVAEIEIALPPLAEQRRIATLLDRADVVRRKREESRRLVDELLRSVFLEMFGDPVRNEKGWEVRPLADLAAVERGRFTPRPRNDPRFYGGVFPFIQTGDIARSSGRVRVWTQTLNNEGVAVSRMFSAGTIALAIAANIGDVALVEFPFCCPDSVVGITSNPEALETEFLLELLHHYKPLLKTMAPQTAQANINLGVLRPLEIPVPSIALQTRFAVAASSIRSYGSSSDGSLEYLTELCNSLRHHALPH